MVSGFVSIVDTADHGVTGDLVTSLDQFVTKRDRLVVIRTDYRFGKRSVRLNEAVSHLRALGDPVIAVVYHVLTDLVACFLHGLLEALASLVGIFKLIHSGYKTDIVSLAL